MSKFSLYFEPDGYEIHPSRVMGRHAAGNGFLRAVVKAAEDGNSGVSGCVNGDKAAQQFAHAIRQISPRVKHELESVESLCRPEPRLDLFVPGPSIGRFASLRLRGRSNSCSIVGITHTIASHPALSSIAELADSAVMPWDALICTSEAVRRSVDELLTAKTDFLQWRLGLSRPPELPQLPVIPLGVHCKDFQSGEGIRRDARKLLKIEDDEVALLYMGRLSFHAKAHPFPLYVGASQAARQTRKKIVLLMCGWFANDAIRQAFVDGARNHFPDGRTIFLDGTDTGISRRVWSAADIFVSLSDNIQESFGLTPVEAMAAGLPVVVTDWDGYRDTVRDQIDGYRIPVKHGFSSVGDALARKYETGEINYDNYCGLSCMLAAPDLRLFAQHLIRLVESPELRASMGAAGRSHVANTFDWAVVLRRYDELLLQLAEIRSDKGMHWESRRPKTMQSMPVMSSPERLFGHFATNCFLPDDRIQLISGQGPSLIDAYRVLASDPLFSFAGALLPPEALVAQLASHQGETLSELSRRFDIPEWRLISAISVLSKMGLVTAVSDQA